MMRSTNAVDTTKLPYASRMLLSAALLGGLALGVVATLAQIFILKDVSAAMNLVFLMPLALLSWVVVPRVWAESTPTAVQLVRTSTPAAQSSVRLGTKVFAERRELAFSRHS